MLSFNNEEKECNLKQGLITLFFLATSQGLKIEDYKVAGPYLVSHVDILRKQINETSVLKSSQ